MLGNSPLLDVSSANNFSQSEACLLILLTLSFTEVFNFNNQFVNSFANYAFDVISKKSSPY